MKLLLVCRHEHVASVDTETNVFT